MKIIEIFKSLQGEGPKIGSPSLFLRLCGCNMKCRFNCNSSKDIERLETEWNTEIEAVNNGAELKDLRLLNSGCDSYPAILPDIYNKIAKDYTDEEIIKIILNTEAQCIIWTGGEPLLQYKKIKSIKEKVLEEVKRDLILFNFFKRTWWFETNGTVDIQEAVRDYNFIVICPKINYMSLEQKEVFYNNVKFAREDISKDCIYFKFVVQNSQQLEELLEYEGWIKQVKNKVYIMPQGSQLDEDFLKRSTDIANKCIDLGLNFTPRLQNYLWKNDWGK